MNMKQFAVKEARPLPVIVLVDISGSMQEHMSALNQSLRGMLASFARESRLNAEIQVAIYTFGNNRVTNHVPLTAAHQVIDFADLQAEGDTPMGKAFRAARELLEDKGIIPSRAYRPTIVLLSDGFPNDVGWEQEFQELRQSERAQKATRMAMAIGREADRDMLRSFINDPETPLFEAHNDQDIIRFFRAVSMSVSSRSRSATPNQPVKIDYDSLPEDDLDLSSF